MNKKLRMLTGIVFCGGKSSRMGSDKGLLQKGSITWAESAFQKLQCLSIKVIISINENQKEPYSRIFPEELLVTDSAFPVWNFEGPLRGLLSVHRHFPETDLFVLACDMTDISIQILNNLKSAYLQNRSIYDYFTYVNKGYTQPMCAIYSGQQLHQIHKALFDQPLVRFSLKNILSSGKTLAFQVQESETSLFSNYNEPLAG
jgi:molybdenum cofactor guanylyltransferase